jgi:hypothetical protein
MARGKFKGKPTGERTFSSEEELGTYAMLAPYLPVLLVGDLFDADAVFLGLAISADVLAWLREEAA